MKNKLNTSILFIITIALVAGNACNKQDSLPVECYENQKDFSFMWWKKTIKTGHLVFAIKTNQYALSFDYPKLAIQDLSILGENCSEEEVLRETNKESFPDDNPLGLRFGLELDGSMSWCDSTSGIDDDCQLVETGKYFQRRFITNLPALKGCDPYNSGLVISSWPDRLSFILKATPSSDLMNIGLVTEITFPEEYIVLKETGTMIALVNPDNGTGFVALKSAEANRLEISGSILRVKLEYSGLCPKGQELNAGLILYPLSADMDSQIDRIVEQEEQPLLVEAKQLAPTATPLKVQYDKDKGWHQILLRSDKTKSDEAAAEPGEGNPGPQEKLNNRMERVLFTVSNPGKTYKVLRLNFAKGRLSPEGSPVFAVPGISAVLRDQDGNPVGIPIQLSKNWHSGGRTGIDSHKFRGTWYHGLSMLTIPARSTLSLEYTSVNSMWGGVPAASHAQLCLIGWGSNQQWDQSAIGSWGENITYEPDLDQASAPVLDFRPLLVSLPSGRKWGWTGNVGGADIFNYTKTDGNRGWHSRIRSQYLRYSPNFTEVTYAGIMDDQSMDFEYTTSVGRSDDLTRGIYKIKLKVLKDTDCNDFVVFQAAAATYHFAKSNTMAWGNETGLKEEWVSTVGGESRYITEKQVAFGKVPWFSFTDGEYSTTHQDRFLPANRGIVIREWKARINGIDNTPPWFAEYNTTSPSHGGPSNLFNIIPPDGCTSFQAGDYIEAEIVLFIVPKKAEDYYGPNKNLKEALEINANGWEMVYREAIGNDLQVEVNTGNLADPYPLEITADNNMAQFSISGGCGYIPLTITNVGDYRNPKLYRRVEGSWQQEDQSVHGSDFWQSEYRAESGTWDITYNVNLDTPGDKKEKVEFKFGLD
ncbi:MAG: hypothetical protein GY790_18960 [Bacteroidetes bacterium]|nr:hypothetical protein [Bacteroidota bacterium]